MFIKKTYITLTFIYTILQTLAEKTFETPQEKLNIKIYYDSFTKNSMNILGSNLKEFLNIKNSLENLEINLNPFAEGSFYQFQKTSLFSCPLGEIQCHSNMIQGCIIKNIQPQNLNLKFISCMNFLKNKFEGLDSDKLFLNCKKALKIEDDNLNKCINNKNLGNDTLLPFAIKASELKGEIYPLIKINDKNLNLNQTHFFSQNITQYICDNYQQNFCKESQIVDKISEEDKNNLKNKINSLITEFETLKNATDKKYDTMTQSLKGVLNGYENNVFTFDEISKNLDNFQQMFNNTITEKSKLSSIINSHLELQRTNLARVDKNLIKTNNKDNFKAKKMLDQNKMILNAIIKRLDILKDDFAYQIMSINENIKMARNHQKKLFKKNKMKNNKKIIRDSSINVNSLDEIKKTPMMIKINLGIKKNKIRKSNSNSKSNLKSNSNSNSKNSSLSKSKSNSKSRSEEIEEEDVEAFEKEALNNSDESDEFHVKLIPLKNNEGDVLKNEVVDDKESSEVYENDDKVNVFEKIDEDNEGDDVVKNDNEGVVVNKNNNEGVVFVNKNDNEGFVNKNNNKGEVVKVVNKNDDEGVVFVNKIDNEGDVVKVVSKNDNEGVVNAMNKTVKEDLDKVVGVIKGFFNKVPVENNDKIPNRVSDIKVEQVEIDNETPNEIVMMKSTGNDERNLINNNFEQSSSNVIKVANENIIKKIENVSNQSGVEDKLDVNSIKNIRENNKNNKNLKNGNKKTLYEIAIENNRISDKTKNDIKEKTGNTPLVLPKAENKEIENNQIHPIVVKNTQMENTEIENNQNNAIVVKTNQMENIDESEIKNPQMENTHVSEIKNNQKENTDVSEIKNNQIENTDVINKNIPEVENTKTLEIKSEEERAMELALAEFN